jgi:hypothetical protein
MHQSFAGREIASTRTFPHSFGSCTEILVINEQDMRYDQSAGRAVQILEAVHQKYSPPIGLTIPEIRARLWAVSVAGMGFGASAFDIMRPLRNYQNLELSIVKGRRRRRCPAGDSQLAHSDMVPAIPNAYIYYSQLILLYFSCNFFLLSPRVPTPNSHRHGLQLHQRSRPHRPALLLYLPCLLFWHGLLGSFGVAKQEDA